MLFQRWVYHPVDPCLWWILTNTHWSSHEQSGQRFYEWSHLRDTKWLSWGRTEFVNHEDFICHGIECLLIEPVRNATIKKECNHLSENLILTGCESVSEFIHALRIPRIHHEWGKYVPVHELDSGWLKSGRPCDGPRTVRILYTYWSNFANLNDNAFRSFSSSVTITGWP